MQIQITITDNADPARIGGETSPTTIDVTHSDGTHASEMASRVPAAGASGAINAGPAPPALSAQVGAPQSFIGAPPETMHTTPVAGSDPRDESAGSSAFSVSSS